MKNCESNSITKCSCRLQLNEYGLFILEYADETFIKQYNIPKDYAGLSIENLLPHNFISTIRDMYNRYTSYELVSKPRRCQYEIESATKEGSFSILDITLSLVRGIPEFKCIISGSYPYDLCNTCFDGFIFCQIYNGTLCCASDSFYNFLEKYNISISHILSLNVVNAAKSTGLPQRVFTTLEASHGECQSFYYTAIPCEARNNTSVLLFIHEIIDKNPISRLDSLTPRENQVIRLAASGLTNRSIAEELNISEGSVKKFLSNCYSKLGISGRVDLYKLL